jgi:rhamnose utilization protein RhaD (predicted bifunctional aldolase and dehydrogenase)/NAD(P)-dependent dehydrogenase (short-subunit alcohol dehydrogenase family)
MVPAPITPAVRERSGLRSTMKNLWSESSAKRCQDDPLQLRVYSSRLLGQEPDLVLHGGGNTSVKVTGKNIFGEAEEILYVKGSGWDLASIEAEGFAPVRLEVLRHMAGFERLSDAEMVRMQRAAMTDPYAPNPSVEAVLHAVIPFRYVDHTHADAVVTITNTPEGEKRIREALGDRVLLVPYVMPGFVLAKLIFDMTRSLDWSLYDGMVLLNHGVFTFGDNAGQSYRRMNDIVTRAERYIAARTQPQRVQGAHVAPDPVRLAGIRKRVSQQRGAAVYAVTDSGTEAAAFAARPDLESVATRGPLTPDHIIRTKQSPLLIGADGDRDIDMVAAYVDNYRAYFDRNTDGGQTCLDPAPRWALWQDCGMVSFGTSLKEARIISDIARHTIKAIEQAQQLGGWRALPERDLFDMEYWELEQAKLKSARKQPALQGKIALVTGAASGIGKACVEALVAQGAAVAALDVAEAIEGMFGREEVLEIRCDVTAQAELARAVQAVVGRFGGLDILVSNAGVFTANECIADMSDATWGLGMDVNLTSHQRLMKLCIPFLRHGLDPAVVIIASKNVPAPGPGAGAYSAAKAGLTQLARVAALELGGDGIRVNVIHPNAVFDTGVWSEEMLAGRAESYGMSVEEYRTNNVLRTEVTSQDVATMVCAMAGPVFAKTTGAQVPVDGGNERVI